MSNSWSNSLVQSSGDADGELKPMHQNYVQIEK